MAKHLARGWVYRTQYNIELSKLNVQLLEKEKVINGLKSEKKKIDMHYTSKTTEHASYMGSKVVQSEETTSPVKFWVSPSRQDELQSIGSPLLSLLEEIPDLVEYRDLLRAVRASIEVLGWPTVAGMKLGLANNLSVTGSISSVTPVTNSPSIFSIPE